MDSTADNVSIVSLEITPVQWGTPVHRGYIRVNKANNNAAQHAMYHGSDFPADELDLSDVNPSSGCLDICLTDSENVAEMYATRWPSDTATIYEFDLSADAVVADEEETLAALGVDADALA